MSLTMYRCFLALLILSSLSPHCRAAASVSRLWIKSLDNLHDYTVFSWLFAKSDVECTALATRVTDVQLVEYNSTTAECKLYKCSLSLPDCRKCRNVNSGAVRQVWIPSHQAGICWTTVQRRVSDSVDFYKTWTEYKTAFGDGPSGNYWIGLTSLHSLTSVSGGRKLRFLMKAWNGSDSWAQYSSFSVGPEADGFRMSVSGFSSSQPGIGDSFGPMSGSMFSTMDNDNDGVGPNVASSYHGAWWFNAVSRSHLNGEYYSPPTALSTAYGLGLKWLDSYGEYYSLAAAEMLIQ